MVEGNDDLHSVVGLVRAQIPWPRQAKDAPVWIEKGKSVDEILQDGYLSAMLKTRDLEALGVMLDADTKPRSRYQSFRTRCSELFPDLPEELPTGGLIADCASGKRLGLWMMPDNAVEGDLETFLRYLIPGESEPLWRHAVQSVETAKELGAPCRAAHLAKANLYTWLA